VQSDQHSGSLTVSGRLTLSGPSNPVLVNDLVAARATSRSRAASSHAVPGVMRGNAAKTVITEREAAERRQYKAEPSKYELEERWGEKYGR
jgi:hypothetical protein